MLTNFSSVGVRGDTNSDDLLADQSGIGRDFVSTLPLGVSGKASSMTNAAGIM